jgi:hypothetical protein
MTSAQAPLRRADAPAAPAPAFQGAWHVREHVCSPEGLLLGTVRQVRRVEPVGTDGTHLRVIQDNEPDEGLAGHAMARFAGHHEFELSIAGARRHYHGPAVLGSALALGDGAMLGRGIWPALGWSFRSYAVTVAPGLQLTGGVFHRGGAPIACIVGVGMAQIDGAAPGRGSGAAGLAPWPELAGPTWPGIVARAWRGTRRRVLPDGEVVGEIELSRRYQEDGAWLDEDDVAWSPVLSLDGGAWRVRGKGPGGVALSGVARSHAWSLSLEATLGPEALIEQHEVLDAVRGHLVGFRRMYTGEVLEHIDVIRLSPV